MALLGMLDPAQWTKKEDATVVDKNRVSHFYLDPS